MPSVVRLLGILLLGVTNLVACLPCRSGEAERDGQCVRLCNSGQDCLGREVCDPEGYCVAGGDDTVDLPDAGEHLAQTSSSSAAAASSSSSAAAASSSPAVTSSAVAATSSSSAASSSAAASVAVASSAMSSASNASSSGASSEPGTSSTASTASSFASSAAGTSSGMGSSSLSGSLVTSGTTSTSRPSSSSLAVSSTSAVLSSSLATSAPGASSSLAATSSSSSTSTGTTTTSTTSTTTGTTSSTSGGPTIVDVQYAGHWSADSSELRRELATSVGRRSFTFATWYKSDNLGTMLLGAGSGATSQSFIWAGTGAGRPFLQHQPGNYSSAPAGLADWPYANQWIHVVLAVDMTATTPESRVRWWINGVQISQETASNDFPQNLDLYIGHTVAHTLGNKHLGDFDWTGKLADTYLIFGHALPASAFVTLSGGQVRSVVYTGPVTSESVHFRYAPGAPGENAFPNNPDWQATNITTDATDVPY